MKIFLMVVFSFMVQFKANAADTSHAVLPLKGIPKNLNIDHLVQVDEAYVEDLLAEGLFDIGEGFQINPVLAESVKWKNNGKILSIKLKDAKFSDGSKVTSDDVIKNLLRCIKNSEKALSLALQIIEGYDDFVSGKKKFLEGLKKISNNELEIATISPSPLLPDALTFSICHVIKGDGSDLFANAVGTGPYQIKSKNEDKIVLQKRKDYHNRSSGPDIIEFRATNSWGDFSKLKDWATLINLETDPGIVKDFNKLDYSQLGTYQLVFNNSIFPFNNENLRKAVLLALDFDLLANELGWSKERLQDGLFPFGMRGFKKRQIFRNTKEAKRLLQNAGYSVKKPFHFTITIARSKLSETEVHVWPRVFNGVPIAVKVELVDQKRLFELRLAGKYQALRVVKIPGTVDGHRILTSYLSHSKFNTSRSIFPECDELIKGSLFLANIDERYAQYEKADKCLMSHVILIPLSSVQQGYVLLRKPWVIDQQTRYNLRPYNVHKWRRGEL